MQVSTAPSEPSSPRPPKHHVGGGSTASAATVVVASCRKSGGEGGESGGEGGGVGLSVRRHSVICSSKVGGDCSSSAARAICSANVGERGDSSSTTGATVLQTGVGSVGGGATEMGDSFFVARCGVAAYADCSLSATIDGVGTRRQTIDGVEDPEAAQSYLYPSAFSFWPSNQ